MACPFFMPKQRLEADWPFPQRLPLGTGWSGTCAAPGHEGVNPNLQELKTGCNMGYAKRCSRLPVIRHADAVRFALGEESGGVLRVHFVCERDYLPADCGELLYQIATGSWLQRHHNACIQRMAECYLQARRTRQPNSGCTIAEPESTAKTKTLAVSG